MSAGMKDPGWERVEDAALHARKGSRFSPVEAPIAPPPPVLPPDSLPSAPSTLEGERRMAPIPASDGRPAA